MKQVDMDVQELFARIGRLTVENQVLKQEIERLETVLAAKESKKGRK